MVRQGVGRELADNEGKQGDEPNHDLFPLRLIRFVFEGENTATEDRSGEVSASGPLTYLRNSAAFSFVTSLTGILTSFSTGLPARCS